MKRNCEITKFSPGVTEEYKGVTYKAVRQENYGARGAHFIREANRVKALEGGCALR